MDSQIDGVKKELVSILRSMQVVNAAAGASGSVILGYFGAYISALPPLAVFLIVTGSIILRNRLSYQAQAYIVVGSLWFTASVGAVFSGGVSSPHLYWCIPPVLLGGLLLGWRIAISVVLMTALVTVAFLLVDQRLDPFFEPALRPALQTMHFASLTGVLGFLFYYSYAYGVILRRAVNKERDTFRALERKNKALELLETTASAANQVENSEEAFKQALENICQFLGWQVGAYYRVENNETRAVSSELLYVTDEEKFGYFKGLVDGRVFNSGEGLPGLTLAKGRPVWIENVYETSEFKPVRDTETRTLYSGIGLPILVGDVVAGIMEFFSTEPTTTDPEVLDVLNQVGTHLGRAFEREQTAQARLNQHKAEASNEAKSAFLANMSHEIRTPMNGVIGMAELLSKMDITEQQHRNVQAIMNSGQTLLRIIDDILDVSKIEAGKMVIELTETDIREMAESIAVSMALAADERNVRLALIIAPNVPQTIESDPIRVRQIIVNLLSNAIKFSGATDGSVEGFVLLKLNYSEDETLEIDVVDNGVGMTPEYVEQLFQPFSQAELSTTRQFGGTGLGLNITHSLVELLGGEIDVDTELGKGTGFAVRIPAPKRAAKVYQEPETPTSMYLMFDAEMNPTEDDPNMPIQDSVPIREFTDERKLAKAVEECDHTVVIGLGMGTMADNIAARDKLVKTVGDRPFVFMTYDRSEKLGYNPDGYWTISRFPVLPSELEAAMHGILQQQEEALAETDEPVEATQEHLGQGLSDHSVLLVEDNEINVVVITTQLKMLGYQADVAKDGAEGLERWKSGAYDIVLTDCHMPVMDGFQLTSEIRTAERAGGLPKVPIIAITANAMEGEADRCIKGGMDDYLSKPVGMDDLSEMLKKWTRLGAARKAGK